MELLGVDTKTKYIEIPKITKELMKKVFDMEEYSVKIYMVSNVNIDNFKQRQYVFEKLKKFIRMVR